MKKRFEEIDEGTGYVGYKEAFRLVVSNVKTLGIEELPLVCVPVATSRKISWPG